MDRATLAAYDNDAAAYAKDWHEQPAPVDLQEIVARFFIKGGSTADIGCGSGREVAWLSANGYPATGYDASDGLLAEARGRYPQLEFAQAELPELDCIASKAFDNVLCETVIMHLDRALYGIRISSAAPKHAEDARQRIRALRRIRGTRAIRSVRICSSERRRDGSSFLTRR